MRETAVAARVIGTGRIFDQQVTVNAVEGIDPGVLVAASIPGGSCSENDPDERLTDWSMAFPAGADHAQLQAAICDVGDLSAAQRLANGCHRDRELVSCGSGPHFPPEVVNDLSLFPQPSASFGADVEALLGSDDPRELVGWHVIVEDEKADGRYLQLLLREDPDTGELQYLVDGSDETFDTPRHCSPETTG